MSHFRLVLKMKDFGIYWTEDTEIIFPSCGPNNVSISFRFPDKNERLAGTDLIVTGTAEIHVSLEHEPKTEFNILFDPDRPQNTPISESGLAIVDSIYSDLRKFLASTISVFRWRAGVRGGSLDPFGTHEFFYSDNGERWTAISLVRHARIGAFVVPKTLYDSEALREVIKLAEQGGEEPLAHQLLREAWSQRTASPRSALILGIAAAEIGLKRLISSLVPNAGWLMEELQAPSIVKILTKYLPTLPVKAHLTDRGIRPPPELVKILQGAVERRNKLVHAGTNAPDREELAIILRAVGDLLWIVDLYSGEIWAAQQISADTTRHWSTNKIE